MINVFIQNTTPRIDYALRLIFETILNSKVKLLNNCDTFAQTTGPKINYSNINIPNCIKIKPQGLLNESHLQYQNPTLIKWDETPAFFTVDESDLPFDIFAASFYLTSRYEEYLPGKRDSHQRFMPRYSIAGQNLFLEKPLVNIWALKLANIIEEKFPGFSFQRSKFRYQPSFDIDNAWAFQHKGLAKFIFAPVKDIIKGNFKTLALRFRVFWQIEHDPYNNYEFMLSTLKQFHFKPITFFLMNSSGKRDRAISHRNIFFRKLILQLAKAGKIGVHPSYQSNKKSKQLSKEIKRLENITGKKIKRSRQHYLKLTFPKTYRSLIENGIKADYSMGYASLPGFRASIATPFYFFDLIENRATNLKIYPFQVMDVTLLNYRHLNPDDAIKKIDQLLTETAKVGGTFISLWHNETLSEIGRWKGWRNVYTEMTRMAAELRDGQKDTTS
ncbi:MAG TPA: polysaccharide deacetylase family protein [Prolixibacteraceae bacterium]|mgnify:CR=1 FL=1|nr:polysaccharide deacetylase family protein [Prolixibacteraceae bacterium]